MPGEESRRGECPESGVSLLGCLEHRLIGEPARWGVWLCALLLGYHCETRALSQSRTGLQCWQSRRA